MEDRELSNEDLRAIELLKQLQAISSEGAQTAIRVSLRMPDGAYVGDALLSAQAVEALTDSTINLNAYLETGVGDPHMTAGPLPVLDDDATEEFLSEIEAFLTDGGQA